MSWSMLPKLALFSVLRWKMPNQISTWLSQLALVGAPVLVLLVCVQVVQDDVDLPVSWLFSDDLVHEGRASRRASWSAWSYRG